MIHHPSCGNLWVLLLLLICSNSFSENLKSIEVAPGVFAFLENNTGFLQHPNQGKSNSGYIVGETGVIVVDSGVSHKTGKNIIADIQQNTDAPIALVILTHANQDFIFGSSAFHDLGIQVVAHPITNQLIKKRCSNCLERLTSTYGEKMHGTHLIIPDALSESSINLKKAGTRVEVFHFGPAKTAGDLVIYHPETGILFAGGMLSAKHIPDMQDSSISNWLYAIDQIEKLHPKKIIPGYGEIIKNASGLDTRAYILALKERVTEIYKNSNSLIDAIEMTPLTQFGKWSSYENNHKKNVQSFYLEVELTEFK